LTIQTDGKLLIGQRLHERSKEKLDEDVSNTRGNDRDFDVRCIDLVNHVLFLRSCKAEGFWILYMQQ
jgi:hypothetical protein